MPTLSPSDVLAASDFVAQRLDQAKRRGLASLAALWRVTDPDDIPGTLDRILPLIVQLMHQQQAAGRVTAWTQAQLAAAVAGPYVDPGLAVLPVSSVRDGLMLSGASFEQVIAPTVPGTLSRIAAGMDPATALQSSQRIVTSMVGSVAHDEARSTTQDTVTSSTGDAHRLTGYARRTEGAYTCDFCRMLATRGPVYSKDTAGFRAHAFCDCTTYAVAMTDHAIDPGDWDAYQRWASRTPNGATTPRVPTVPDVPAPPPRLVAVEAQIASYEPVIANAAGTQWMRDQMPRLYAERDQLLAAAA